MPRLPVPGASLYYETSGKDDGPLLLCISGAGGHLEYWPLLAQHLQQHFRIVMYDRRGHSRSGLIGAQDFEHRLEADADDAAALIEHLSDKSGPVLILGSSSGGIVALQFVLRHADKANSVITIEPPLFCFNPNFDELNASALATYNIYRKSGIRPALEDWVKWVYAENEKEALFAAFDPGESPGPYSTANTMFWMERELLPYPAVRWEASQFQSYKDRLHLLIGEGTSELALQYRASATLGQQLGIGFTIMPGAHVGFLTHAEAWAKEFIRLVQEKKLI